MSARMPRIGLYLGITLILVVALFPFWWMVDTSLKQPVDIFGGVTLYPHHPTTNNYSRLFNTYHFASYLENSLIIVAVSVAFSREIAMVMVLLSGRA